MKKAVLGIRDILLLIWIRGSIPLDPDLKIWFVLQALFQSALHLYEKREKKEGSGSIPMTIN